jgi:hypothetical protein
METERKKRVEHEEQSVANDWVNCAYAKEGEGARGAKATPKGGERCSHPRRGKCSGELGLRGQTKFVV